MERKNLKESKWVPILQFFAFVKHQDFVDEMVNFSNSYASRDAFFYERIYSPIFFPKKKELKEKKLYYLRDMRRRWTNYAPWREGKESINDIKEISFETKIPYPPIDGLHNWIWLSIVIYLICKLFYLYLSWPAGIIMEPKVAYGLIFGIYKVWVASEIIYISLNYLIHCYEMHVWIQKELKIVSEFRYYKVRYFYFRLFRRLGWWILKFSMYLLIIQFTTEYFIEKLDYPIIYC